jgi:anti-sigma B factor antagonist/stage II sporulation protein AA (anti-sigma F factor antagonist)
MDFTTRRYADVVVARPVGRIDHAAAGRLEQALAPLLAADAGNAALLFDLSGVDYVSSVGLRVLMIAAKQMRARNGRIAVCGLQPVVAEIFGISRFDAVLEVHPSLEAALAKLSPAALDAWRGGLEP